MSTIRNDGATTAVMTTRELRLLIQLLEKHVLPLGENVCQYRDGWTDQKIADEIGRLMPRPAGIAPIGPMAVLKRRVELYGRIKTLKADKDSEAARLAALEDRVKVLEDLLIAKK